MNPVKAAPKPGRYVLQISEDGEKWFNTKVEISSRKAAQETFDHLANTNALDWRVGFLMHMRDGKHPYYRILDTKTGTTLK